MNVITAWSTTCRLIIVEVDYELSAMKLHVGHPIQLEKHTKDTPEIEILLGWMLPHVKGDLRRLHPPASEELPEKMQALSIQPKEVEPTRAGNDDDSEPANTQLIEVELANTGMENLLGTVQVLSIQPTTSSNTETDEGNTEPQDKGKGIDTLIEDDNQTTINEPSKRSS